MSKNNENDYFIFKKILVIINSCCQELNIQVVKPNLQGLPVLVDAVFNSFILDKKDVSTVSIYDTPQTSPILLKEYKLALVKLAFVKMRETWPEKYITKWFVRNPDVFSDVIKMSYPLVSDFAFSIVDLFISIAEARKTLIKDKWGERKKRIAKSRGLDETVSYGII